MPPGPPADLSRLLGEVEVSESSNRWGERSTTVSIRTGPILESARLRTLPFGTGVLLLRSAPPIVVELTRWTDRPAGTRLTGDRTRLENAIRAGARR